MAVDQLLEVRVGKFHYAGALRTLKFREKGPVFRKNSTRGKLLRLLILDPVPYGKGKTRGYNHRAFLLSTDLNQGAEILIATYLMRWELEVVHRIWKTDLGIGDAQVRKNRVPAAMAAYYALLLVANRLVLGEERNEGFGPLTKWAANRRKWFEDDQAKDGKPKPRYRASLTDLKAMIMRAMARKGVKVLAMVA